jgi:galactoside O-acetyltransferase
MGWIPRTELERMGFAASGENVLISEKASLYNCAKITLGSNIRIDDFCVLSAGAGGIEIGDYVHIALQTSLIGAGKIRLSAFSGLSSRVSIYSSNEDYSGAFLTNPTIPPEYSGVTHADVLIGKHVIVGSGSIVLPGVTIEDGCAIAALSLVKNNCEAFGIYSGVPVKRIRERKRDLLDLEKKLIG